MPTPTPRTRITIGRGTFANLQASVADLAEGEMVLATDQDKVYAKLNGGLVLITTDDAVTSVNGKVGDVVLDAADVGAATTAQGALADTALQPGDAATPAQGALADTALQPGEAATPAQGALADSALQSGDDISELTNDAGYITAGDVPAAPVTSVAGKTGAVTLQLDDITDWDAADYATAAQGALADSALQSGDNVSELTNDAGYITSGDVPAAPVTSVAGKTGDVTLVKGDVGLGNVDNTSDADKPISVATQSALDNKADLVNGVVPNSQLPSIAISEYLGTAADQAAMLALDGQEGDWCIRTDTSSTWVVTGNDSSQLSSWTELATPADLVTSVNGYQGAVVLSAADVGAVPAADQYWQRAGGVISPLNSGDSLDVDGTGTFAGSVEVNDFTPGATDDKSGIRLNSSGSVQMGRSGTDTLIAGYNTASSGGSISPTVEVKSDGSGTFAGNIFGGSYPSGSGAVMGSAGVVNIRRDASGDAIGVYSGGTNLDDQTVSIKSDGSGTFAGGITSNFLGCERSGTGFAYVSGSSTNGFSIYDSANTTPLMQLGWDGSGTFDGDVTANGLVTDNGNVKVFLSSGDGGVYVYDSADTSDPNVIINKDGSAEFKGRVNLSDTSGNSQLQIGNSFVFGSTDLYLQPGGNTTLTLYSDTSAAFTSTVTSPASFQVNRSNGKTVTLGGSDGTALWNSDATFYINHDGTANFSGTTTVGGGIDTGSATNTGHNIYSSGEYYFQVSGSSSGGAAALQLYRGTEVTFKVTGDGYTTGQGYNSYPTNSSWSGLTVTNPDNAANCFDVRGNGDVYWDGALRAGDAVDSSFTQGFISDPTNGNPYNQFYTNNSATNNVISVYNGNTGATPFFISPAGNVNSSGTIIAGGDPFNGGARGCSINQFGTFRAAQNNSANSVFEMYVAGDADPNIVFTAGGGSRFQDRLNIGNGTSTNLNDHSIVATNNTTSAVGTATIYGQNMGGGRLLDMRNSSSSIMMELESNGNLVCAGDITAFSDIKLKENIEQIPNALDKVSTLRGVTYDRVDTGERQTGVIAQEVEAVLPEAVSTNEEGIKGVAYGNLVGLLIESIKELQAEVEALKQERN